MRTVALVPAKSLAGAKSRLSPLLDEAQRAAVALDMLRTVLEAVRQTNGIAAYGVVGNDDRVLAIARELGAEAIVEPGSGLNRALEHGRAWALGAVAEALLVVLSDLPLLRPPDLEAVLAEGERAAVGIAPSKDGGTNALLLRPPDAVPFRFGRDSARYHRFEAEQRGLAVALVHRDTLAFDVDVPADLARYHAPQPAAGR